MRNTKWGPLFLGLNMIILIVSASRIITKDLVTKLQRPNCALVTQMPFTADWEGFPAAVEKVGWILFRCNIM